MKLREVGMKNFQLGVMVLFLCGCSMSGHFSSAEDYDRDLLEKLSFVTVEDGISYEEAEIISDCYFVRFKKISGGWSKPYDFGDYWVIKQKGCVTGVDMEQNPLKIEKNSGIITWESGPTILNPLEIGNE